MLSQLWLRQYNVARIDIASARLQQDQIGREHIQSRVRVRADPGTAAHIFAVVLAISVHGLTRAAAQAYDIDNADVETSNWQWDPIAEAYYWHRFFFEPDLNYDHSAVIEAIKSIIRFWLDLGVDGIKLERRWTSLSSATARAARTCPRRMQC